jgi:hypothetical protein
MINIFRVEMLLWIIVTVAVLTGSIMYVKRKRQD